MFRWMMLRKALYLQGFACDHRSRHARRAPLAHMPDLKLTVRNGEPRRLSIAGRHDSTDAGMASPGDVHLRPAGCCDARRAWASRTSSCAPSGTRSRTACSGAPRRKASPPSRSRRVPPATWPACSAATSCSRSTARPSRRRPTSSSISIAGTQGTRLSYTLVRLGTQQALRGLARAGQPPVVDVLRARGGRSVHAAGRRVGSPAAAARSGDAAFLLAVRRVLRRVHLLVQRTVRSARLDVLLGRRGGDGAAAAAAAALHAGVSRSVRRGARRCR